MGSEQRLPPAAHTGWSPPRHGAAAEPGNGFMAPYAPVYARKRMVTPAPTASCLNNHSVQTTARGGERGAESDAEVQGQQGHLAYGARQVYNRRLRSVCDAMGLLLT